MSFLNTSTTVRTKTILSAHITKADALTLLHDNEAMHALNPIIKSHTLLSESSSAAFFSHVPSASKPPTTGPLPPSGYVPVYHIVEASNNTGESGWRGGWASRFIPDEIVYETSMQNTADGMITITHAPMGVKSVTKWVVRDGECEGAGLVLEKEGVVSSNRMLMGFIRTTIQESYEKLARDFAKALETKIAEERGGEGVGEPTAEGEKIEESSQEAGAGQKVVEAVA